MEDWRWESDGICAESGGDARTPDVLLPSAYMVRMVVKLCNECPVLPECWEDVLAGNVLQWSIKAGLLPSEQAKVSGVRRIYGRSNG